MRYVILEWPLTCRTHCKRVVCTLPSSPAAKFRIFNLIPRHSFSHVFKYISISTFRYIDAFRNGFNISNQFKVSSSLVCCFNNISVRGRLWLLFVIQCWEGLWTFSKLGEYCLNKNLLFRYFKTCIWHLWHLNNCEIAIQ